jgi:hypothetical protein
MRRLTSLLLALLLLSSTRVVHAEGKPADRQPPVFQHTPVTTATQGDNVTIITEIDDDSEIFAPLLWYRYPGAASFSSIDLVRKTGKLWSATIPAPEESIDYWLEAYDELGNGPAREGGPDQPFHITVKPKPPVYKQPEVVNVAPDAGAAVAPAPVQEHHPIQAEEAKPPASSMTITTTPTAPSVDVVVPSPSPVVGQTPALVPLVAVAPVPSVTNPALETTPAPSQPAPVAAVTPPAEVHPVETPRPVDPPPVVTAAPRVDPPVAAHVESAPAPTTPNPNVMAEPVDLTPRTNHGNADMVTPPIEGGAQPPPGEDTPIYKKWWAVTGAVVVVGAVVGAVVYAVQPSTVQQNVFTTSLRRP